MSKYPYSDVGQKATTADVIKMLNQHKNVNSLFWWWMEYNANGTSLSGWYNAPIFDSNTGKATSALYELKNFLDASTGISPTTANNKSKADKSWYTLDGKKIETPNQNDIYIQKHKKIAIKK